ncbi:MAG TPA: transglycosylase SLT domain-containing protein [Candidatus Acidoferrum sp.]|nr:transglycosylase SLT domain-containing protein [Candidatus Acidoferrum sp.]
MTPAFVGFAVFGFILAAKHFLGGGGVALAFAGNSGDGGGGAGSVPEGTGETPTPPPSGVAMQWNNLIAVAAQRAGVDPVLMKAITAVESGFNADSINPERDFTLDGVDYTQNDRSGRAALVRWIKDGNDPASIGLSPSCGMMQIRVSVAKQLISGLDAWDLFDPATNFEAGSYLAAQMGSLFAVDTADVWNVGAGRNWQNGMRNIPYRDKVANFYQRFQGDFQS